MIKLIGACLLLIGSGGLGVAAVAYLQSRVDCLRAFSAAVGLMGKELDFRLTPLPDLFLLMAERTAAPVSNFFETCRKGVLTDLGVGGLSQIWSSALRTNHLPLHLEEIQTLETLGIALGRYDADNQRRILEYTGEELRLHLRKAEAERLNMGRVYGTLCLSAGALMMIVLF